MGERDVYIRGNRWWGVIPRGSGESTRESLGLPSSAPKTEALARWLERARGQRAADATAATPRVGEAFDDYLAEQRRRGRSESTREIDRQKAGHFIRLWGRNMPLHHVSAKLVADYIAQREKEAGARKGSRVHGRTIQRELVVLRGMLKLALHHGRFTMPLERIMPLGFAPRYEPRKRHLSLAEAEQLLEELPRERRGWFAFALATGARKSEIEKATLADIGDDEVFIRGTKTRAAADTVPVTSVQRPWLRIAKQYANKAGPAFGVWSNARRGLEHACARLSTCARCRSLGEGKARGTPNVQCFACRRMPRFEPVTPNDLRRTLGYWLRDAGVEPHLIGKVLRHVDSRMAEAVYARDRRRGFSSSSRHRFLYGILYGILYGKPYKPSDDRDSVDG